MYRLKPFGVLNGREVPVIELFSDKCAVELLPYDAETRMRVTSFATAPRSTGEEESF